jgi:beta-glucanase (GH16 family)
MRRVTIPLIAAMALLITACGGPQYFIPAHHGRVTPGVPGRWQLTQQYSPARLASWRPAPWPANNPQQIACYTNNDVSRGGGDVLLHITSRPCDGRPESGAWLQSSVKWRYGLYEARIYLPASSSGEIANWPAFWLENPYKWPVNGEIDALESWRGWDCQAIHYGPAANKRRTVRTTPNCVMDTPGWHVFAVAWSAKAVKWYIDGHLTGIIRSHVPHHRVQIVLDYTAWRNQHDNLAPATMRVAWVRIFKPAR